MKISVVLCTYNRCQSLDKTLESVAASILSAETEWEVLIVDNNSNDRTKDVVESFSSRYPGRFRYLFEPRQGKSFALNAGVRESLGNVLAFLDDDVTVEPTWLGILAAPLNGNEWAGTGGRTLLERPFSPPSWLAVDGPFSMGGYWPPFSISATSHANYAGLPTAPIWPIGRRCSRNMGSFAPTWVLAQTAIYLAKARTLSSVAA